MLCSRVISALPVPEVRLVRIRVAVRIALVALECIELFYVMVLGAIDLCCVLAEGARVLGGWAGSV